jgi:phenylalanyl-tRNA synthetase beta subunit
MRIKKQLVLDISATANRSDSLSIQGFSLEIAALLNKLKYQIIHCKIKIGITKLKNFLRVFLLKVLVRHCYQSLLKT